MQHNQILSYSIWLPIVAGFALLMLGSDSKANFTRWLALGFSLLAFAVTLPLYTQFDFARGAFQFEEMAQWIPSFNVNYHLGVDGISAPLILLTSFTTVIVVIASWQVITKNIREQEIGIFFMGDNLSKNYSIKKWWKAKCDRRQKRQAIR